jgi:Protein of unknown function (DUF2924)
MPTLSVEKPRNLESPIPKKGSAQSFASRRQKAPSGAASPKKQLRPVGSKPARATGAERPPKADEPQIERIIRQKKRPHSGESLATQIAAAKPIDIAETLARLSALTIFELRGEWRRLHRAPPPMRLSRDLLMRGITYKLQERRLGGLSKSILRKLEGLDVKSKASGAHKPTISLKAGTRLIRQWRGVTHTVLVHADSFEWKGRRYRSLTSIAHKITAAHWSGPRFFGLRKGGRSGEATEGKDAQA